MLQVKKFDEVGALPRKFQKHPLGEASIKIILNLTKIKNPRPEAFSAKKNQKYARGEASRKIMLNFKIPDGVGCFCKKKYFNSEPCVNYLANHQSEAELSTPASPYNFEHERAIHTKQKI